MKKFLITIVIITLLVGVVYYLNTRKNILAEDSSGVMTVEVFIQDKEAAATRDCGITKKTSYIVPKSENIIDSSLKILFEKDLPYGIYDTVSIDNVTANIMLKRDMVYGLSSCESRHLMSTLEDTLAQFGIKTVVLFSPSGKIGF